MRAALAFLTPLGRARVPDRWTPVWFAPVGALLALGVAVVWDVGTEQWNPLVGAALAVAADLALTGMLHVDGLADSADGLVPHLPAERRLAVMEEPQVGAFGLAVVAATLLVRVTALTALAPGLAVLVPVWMASRAMMAVALARVPYARPDGGMASALHGGSVIPPVIALGVAGALALRWAPIPRSGLAAVGLTVGVFVLVVGVAVRRVGGYTGDVLGAGGVLGETAGILALGASW